MKPYFLIPLLAICCVSVKGQWLVRNEDAISTVQKFDHIDTTIFLCNKKFKVARIDSFYIITQRWYIDSITIDSGSVGYDRATRFFLLKNWKEYFIKKRDDLETIETSDSMCSVKSFILTHPERLLISF